MDKESRTVQGRTPEEKKRREQPAEKQTPKAAFVLLLVIYLADSVLMSLIARSHVTIELGDTTLPLQSFMGVFSSLANICIILLVVFFAKTGFYTALILLALQFPVIFFSIFVARNLSNISGLFSNLLTIVAICIIYMNFRKIGEYQTRMRHQAVTDRLTGLPNRFACTELMNDLVRRGIRFALVSIDLKDFKSVNDTMGHEIGDRILVEIASRLKAKADSWQAGTIDFVAYMGGDEYTLVIRNYHSNQNLTNSIESYQAELEKKITVDDCDYYMTAHFGYAEYPEDAQETGSLFSCADAAMHEAKRRGIGSQIMRFTTDLTRSEHALDIERKVRAALDGDGIFFHLQPIYDTDHRLKGFEALARIRDTDGTFLQPAEFIPIAEKTGLIDRIDTIVMRKAAVFMGEQIKNGGVDLILSVNISVRHLMKNGFIAELKDILRTSGIPAEHLQLEITESIMSDAADKAMRRIKEIKNMGIRIALDDLRTGYSSLSHLNDFPSNILKIDKSFINAMESDALSRQYVEMITSLGRSMNVEVVSEGVETKEQLEALQRIGCDYIQGYIWGRPMSPDKASKLITSPDDSQPQESDSSAQ
ncbi:MAG: bifunctional diguanylate cyclase/phosphodiesterase [Lachnospiraceae bacterium]|nr:bifunctional diguanylate cyclase/phosphodiesterase [Lachnospiraceae bacterium]